MPTFRQIQNQFNSAKARNLIGPDESLADFAKKALEFTGDPSYKSVAKGGMIGNFVRGASADLTNFVNSGPVDEWTSEAVGQIGDLFGVDPEASRSMGARLPRMVVDFLPMMAAAPFTGGASLLPAVGMGVTSALSAASAYEDAGDVGSAIIGGAAPYLGTALAQRGGQAALGLAAKSPALQKLGFTGGTKYVNAALSEAERASLAASGNLSAEAIAGATVNKTVVEKLADKGLGYLGGQLAANAGFFGIDTAYHGPSTTFNRDYLFNSLVGNVAFGLADIPRAFRPNVLPGSQKFNLPEASPIYLSDGERRALLAASKFADLKSPEAVREYRQKYGLDMADIAIRTEELATALNRKELGLREAEDTFTSKWNNYVQNSPEAQQAGFKPVQQGGAFGKERLNIKELMGQEGLPIEAQKIVDEYRMKRTSLQKEVNGTIARLGRPVNTVDSLKLGVQQLGLDEFLNTPIEQRDYVKALEGTMMSLDGADLIRDIHRVQAGLEPVRKDLYQNYVDLFAGKDVEFTPDKSIELLVAASLARGQTPKFTRAKEKVKQAVEEGQTEEVVAEKAIEGLKEENKEFVGPPEQKITFDPNKLEELRAQRIKLEQELIQAQVAGEVADERLQQQNVYRLNKELDEADERFKAYEALKQQQKVAQEKKVKSSLVAILAQRSVTAQGQETRPQVEQTVVEKLIAAIPAKWPDEVKAIAEEFYRTGDDTKFKNLGIDPTSEVRKKAMYRALKEADPTYEQRLKAREKAYNEREAKKQKILNQIPAHEEDIDLEFQAVLDDRRVDQEMIPEEFFRAEDWSRVKDKQGNEYLIPVPEGEFQQVEQFARELMSKLVSPEMLPESSKELIELAKLFNNPEVVYAWLKGVVEGQGDAQFARASAGAFDFGMREVVDGKLIRKDKPNNPLGTKDGWMTEQEFRVNGSDLGTLQKAEVEFYKQLVPEAFADGKVHLQKLWDGLNKVGESVKVDVYGQSGDVNPAKVELDLVEGELDIIDSNWQENYVSEWQKDSLGRRTQAVLKAETPANIRSLVERRNKAQALYVAPKQELPKATSYYDQISPFDTKKNPIVRFDVSIPGYKGIKPDGLHTTIEGTIGWAMVQFVPDPRTGEIVAFIAEQQSEVAQERSRYSIEPATKAGTFDVWYRETGGGKRRVSLNEPSKESAQQYIDSKAPPHPILESQANLVLKAVIREAQKRGVKKVVVSDGETAMMTEGHDQNLQPNYSLARKKDGDLYTIEIKDAKIESSKGKGGPSYILPFGWKFVTDINTTDGLDGPLPGQKAQGPDGEIYRLQLGREGEKVFADKLQKDPLKPSQEGGMRLHYDTTLPSVMRKLTGSEGEKVDMGVHKNQLKPDSRGAVDRQPWVAENTRTGELHYGQSKEALESRYDQAIWTIKENPVPADVGTNLGSPVFRNPDGTPKTSVTGRIYDISNLSPRADTLFAQNQGQVYGAASYKAKQILINSKAFQGLRASDRAVFVFAHEQPHISFAKALEGRYGPQAKIQAEKALAWANAADPQAKKNVEDVVKELHLDKELAQMDGVRDVLNNPDPQEWLANVMGMYGFGAVKSKAPKQAFAMLPKPVREFAEWLVRHLQNLSKGAMTWLRLSGKDYQGAKHTKELFDSIRRSYRQAEWEAAQAERFLDIEPTSMFDRGEEFAFAQGKMGEVGEQPFKDAPKRWIGGMWNKIIQPMHTLGNLYEGFKQPVMAVFNAHSDTENAIGDVFKVVVGELGADEKVRMTNEAFKKVMGSEQLNKLFNQIQVRSQVLKKRMIKLNDQNTSEVLDFEALSPELRGRLQQFNPEAQKALATMVAQAERANILHQEKILQGEWQGSVHDFATLLAAKISFNKQDYGKAVEISKGALNDLKMANETRSEFDQQRFMAQAQSKLAQLEESDQVSARVQAQEIFKRYDDLKKYYDDHPTWMSFRRYGKIRQRIEKNGEFPDVIDAETEKELAETLKFYTEQGWKQVGKRQVVEKELHGQYYLNDALLKIMQDREGQFKTMLQEANIPEEEKARLMAVPSATAAMISEINSRELYRPTKGRKLTGDLERFDWWEQFQRYTPAALAAAQRRALGAKINYWMQNPELDGLKLQKDQFMALYEQSKKPDPEWARKLNKLNAVWHIGWNLPGHIAEVFQPMLSGVHELVAKGESLPGAIKQFYKAEKDVGKVWGYRLKDKFFKPEDARVKINDEVFEGLPALWLRTHGESKENVDIARMLHAKRDRIQKAPLSEIRNFTGEQHAKLQDVISGNRQRTLGEIIASPFTMYANAAMNFYSKFTQHNGIVTMVTAYRKFKKQGMTHEQAMDAAELFDLTVNNSGGRLERPEMFGKLGGAGHLPYGLTSYVRGRFSQLATYYRHGFETEAFGNLTPAERGNAKKAFQTMILAQLGAAGILGIPFVGAGIALMEELLGEDLKGKMINALDEVTNDPMLTRVFTHGMMSTMAESFGLPADLHSRFALSSFLGTNSYDGMSAKSFMGPSVAMLDSMFNLGGQIAKGESMEKALTVAGPGGVKRLAEALGEEYQRENPESNLLMSMLGFRSSQQVKKKEWEQITRKQELETRRKLEQSAMAISKALEAGSINGRKQLLIEADKLLPKGLDFQQTVKQRQQNIKDLIQKVSMIEADKVGPQDVRREISGRLAPIASQTAQSMGVQMSNPMELARALQQQKTRSQLGATVSQRPVRNAMLQELQWGNNQWDF